MKTEASNECFEIDELISQLGDSEGSTRAKARERLVEMGGIDVTRALIHELNDPRRDVRWEAAKALVSVADSIAAPALVQHLSDEDGDIRWLAAEGLAELGKPGLLATLNAATRHASDPEFCKAVHHSLKEFSRHGIQAHNIAPVIKACECSEPGVSLPVAAFEALNRIKVKPK